MSANQTPNYKLCQWEESDKVLRTEFNADNAKIDAGIKAVDRRVDSLSSTVSGKASTSALNSLKTAVDALSQTVGQHTSALTKAGTCVFYTTSYTGNGKYGSANPTTLTFPHKPMVVLVGKYNGIMILFRGLTSAKQSGIEHPDAACSVTWNAKSVQWFGGYADAQMNSGGTYYVIALLSLE